LRNNFTFYFTIKIPEQEVTEEWCSPTISCKTHSTLA